MDPDEYNRGPVYKRLPDPNLIRSYLSYRPETGEFRWKVNRTSNAKAGSLAGMVNEEGYLAIKVDRVRYLAHRLAWLYVTGSEPTSEVDHINGIRNDNRFSNLRLASRSQNSWNHKRRKDNRSGLKGVSYHKYRRKWQAGVVCNKVRHYLGLFDSKELAQAAYEAKSRELFGAFMRDKPYRDEIDTTLDRDRYVSPGDPDASEYPDRDPGDEAPPPPFTEF